MITCDAVTIIIFSMSFLKPVFRKLLTALITLLFSYASLTLTLLSELYKDLLYTSTRFLIKFSCRLTRLTRPTRLTRLDFKIAILWKWLWTFITWKRFLTSVGSDMNLTSLFHENDFGHWSHGKGFSPFWFLLWILKWLFCKNDFGHWSQGKGFSPFYESFNGYFVKTTLNTGHKETFYSSS